MPLAPGTQVGPFQITASLGAGGMGEVYRASDTRLKRDVALKVLPEAFAHDAQRMARFGREAQLLASLNHSHIAHLYGLEESNGIRALVIELVEGSTLAERIGRGPIPVEEAAEIAKQIADALEYAHDKGIIHRDLKPSNIKIGSNAQVKVLDFGLAKAMETDGSELDISTSPTISIAASRAGMLLGTAAYMSPEQAKGKSVDRRADIWAFGCVLFEMLAGKPAFGGETITDTLAAVVRGEPEWDQLPAKLPSKVRDLLQRCLNKDPKQRLQAIGEARIILENWLQNPDAEAGTAGTATAKERSRRGERIAWGVAAVLGVAVLALAAPFMQRSLAPVQTVRLISEIGTDAKLYAGYGISSALSPDGSRVAIVASGSDEKHRLYVRALDQLQATVLPGTEDAESPFFSPDGRWLGFFASGKLKKIAVEGGAVVTLCDAPRGLGGTWGEDGSIVFAPDIRGALFKVSSSGGAPVPLTTLDAAAGEATERWPQYLPGGRAVVFTSDTHGGNYEDAEITAYSISSGQRKKLVSGGYYGRYLPTGHLVYMHEGTLFAIPFDVKRLELSGSPTPILEGVSSTTGYGSVQFSFSENGTVTYIPGHGGFPLVTTYWLDRQGKFTPIREKPGDYYEPAFSPDGKRLALRMDSDISVYDLARDTLTRLTFDGNNRRPLWTPDGQKITYAHFAKAGSVGAADIYWTHADGTGSPLRLTDSSRVKLPFSWHPSGKLLVFGEGTPDGKVSILTLAVEGDEKHGWKAGEIKPLATSSFLFLETGWSFSPDGRWLAYMSNENGHFDVYVRPFEGSGGKWQVSTAGGLNPKWSRTGKELFYSTPDNRVMVAPYTVSGESFSAGQPQLWSPGQFTDRLGLVNYDVHPDGKRVVVLKTPIGSEDVSPSKFAFVFNFFDELRQKVPSGK